MLDALLAEARLRWGLDLADGVAVIPAERLVGLPLEPTRRTRDRAAGNASYRAAGRSAHRIARPPRDRW